MRLFAIIAGLVCSIGAEVLVTDLQMADGLMLEHQIGERRLQEAAPDAVESTKEKKPNESIQVEFPTTLNTGKTSGLLLDNVLQDINQCAVEIITKHDLKDEAKYISGVLADQKFIEIMEYGNYTEIREAIVKASGKIIDRLGQDTEMILKTMPDPVVEWLRVTALLSKVDMSELDFVRNGSMTERKKVVLNKQEAEKAACEAEAKKKADAEIEKVKAAANKEVNEANAAADKAKADRDAADKAAKEARDAASKAEA